MMGESSQIGCSASSGGGSYRRIMSEILLTIHNEACPKIQQDVAIDLGRVMKEEAAAAELLKADGLNSIYLLLLKENNNDFKKMVETISKFIQRSINDLPQKCKDQMTVFEDRMNRDSQSFYLEGGGDISNRQSETDQLYKWICTSSSSASGASLVNIYGDAGIGKSYLIRHFASSLLYESGVSLVYVDARSVSDWTCLLTKILDRLDIDLSRPYCDAELLGLLLDHLQQYKLDERLASTNDRRKMSIVLILDDVDNLISSEGDEFLYKIHNIFQYCERQKIQLKIMMTSESRLTAPDDDGVRNMIRNRTQQLQLGPLSDQEALQYMELSKSRLTAEMKASLLKNCAGHPLSIHLIKILAEQEYTAMNDMSQPIFLSIPSEAAPATIVRHLLSSTFHNLPNSQRQCLLAVALFDGDAQLGHLCEITKSWRSDSGREDKGEDYKRLRTEFSNGFWLNFITLETRVEAEGKMVVCPYHPLIGNLLKETLQSSMPQQKQLIERYICYHIGRLIKIGSQCVHSPIEASTALYKEIPNILKAFQLIDQLDNPALMFRYFNGSDLKIRELADIIYLFLCVHQYHEQLHGSLINFLRKAVDSRTSKDLRTKLLLRTLYALILTARSRWDTLAVISDSLSPGKECDPKKIQSEKALYKLCSAINYYTKAMLDLHCNKPQTDIHSMLSKAYNHMGSFQKRNGSSDTEDARQYFTTYIELAREKYRDAEKHCRSIQLLSSRVNVELAFQHIQQGCACVDLQEANSFFKRANNRLYKDVHCRGAFKSIQQLYFDVIIASRLSILISRLSSADVRYRSVDLVPYLTDIESRMYEAYHVLYMRSCYGGSEETLLRFTLDLADIYLLLRDFYSKLQDSGKVERYQQLSSTYYLEAASLVMSDSQRCNVPALLAQIEQLIRKLPHLQTDEKSEGQTSDDIIKNLQVILENVSDKVTSEDVLDRFVPNFKIRALYNTVKINMYEVTVDMMSDYRPYLNVTEQPSDDSPPRKSSKYDPQ